MIALDNGVPAFPARADRAGVFSGMTRAILSALLCATAAGASGPESYLGEDIVVPPGDVRLLPTGTGATGGILTPVPTTPDGCSYWSGCDVLPDQETIPAVPVPSALWLLAGAIGVLAMMKRDKK